MSEIPQIQWASLCDGENPWQGKEGRVVCAQEEKVTSALGEEEIRSNEPGPQPSQEIQTCSRCICHSGALAMLL